MSLGTYRNCLLNIFAQCHILPLQAFIQQYTLTASLLPATSDFHDHPLALKVSS